MPRLQDSAWSQLKGLWPTGGLAGLEFIYWGTTQPPHKLYLATISMEKPSMEELSVHTCS